MSDPEIVEIARIAAPYRREIVLQDVLHDSGLRLLRVRIREGHRFTIVDLDASTGEDMARLMLRWVEQSAVQATGEASDAGGMAGGGDGDGE